MAASVFDFVATRLQQVSGLDKLEARGTVRIALRAAGLDPRSVTADQMAVMLLHTMPAELTSRGVGDAAAVCRAIAAATKEHSPGGEEGGESPEDVFRRLGRTR